MRKIYYNGKVYTNEGFHEAFIVNENLIEEIGSSDSLLKKGIFDEKIDLNKQTVLPGFNDSHLHLFLYGKSLKCASLNSAKSIEDLILIGKNYLEKHPDTDVLIGEGYNQENFTDKKMPTRYDLDQISNSIPIIYSRICGHIITVNSKVLEIAKITKDIKVPGGGIEKDENGNPSGNLTENAHRLIKELFPLYGVDESKKIIDEGVDYALRNGVTSVQTNDIDLNNLDYLVKAYSLIALEEKIRICHQVTLGNTSNYLRIKRNFISTPFNRLGPLKIFLDGSLGARTAALNDGYIADTSNFGVMCYTQNEIDALVKAANENEVSLVFHAIGDRAIADLLRAFEKTNKEGNPLRHGIIHLQITTNDILQEMAKKDICALVQPAFLNTDMEIIEKRVSEKLINSSYAYKTMVKTLKTSFGTDLPVEDINPFKGIYLAITRRNFQKTKIYNNDQFITVKEAIDAYTIGGSYMSFEEDKKGMLKKDYLADFIIIDKDIFTIDYEEIKDIRVIATYVDGKKVFDSKN